MLNFSRIFFLSVTENDVNIYTSESALSKFSVTENAVLLPDSDIGPYRFQTYSDVSDEMVCLTEEFS